MFIKNVEDIAELVKSTRIEQGLTQVKLAQLCGVGTRFIIDLEKGKPTCQIEKVLKIIHSLGIKVNMSSTAEAKFDFGYGGGEGSGFGFGDGKGYD